MAKVLLLAQGTLYLVEGRISFLPNSFFEHCKILLMSSRPLFYVMCDSGHSPRLSSINLRP
jgi:hypothetical protein